jgi:very-short-patch-repair endonuclease
MMFEFDFELLDSIIIECDGIQHFQNVMFFKKKNLKSNRERDLFKQKCALENNYSVIRISQEDVYYNRFDWKTSLMECIKNIQKNNLITVNYL